jgi:hypothetical protein
MKSVEVQLFEFSELSNSAKEKALADYVSLGGYFDISEAKDSLEAFAGIFPIKLHDWNYGWGGTYINFDFAIDDWCSYGNEIAELSGWRLATYIWNNYKNDIYKGKYYSTKGYYDDKGKYHYKHRHSKIILETGQCPYTGVCYDEDLLDPLWKFMKNPDDTTFEDLMIDCLYSWLHSVESEDEYQSSEEVFKEICNANEWLFTVDGKWWR